MVAQNIFFSIMAAGMIFGAFKVVTTKNVVHAAANMKMLGVIFFSLLFGYFIGKLNGRMREVQELFWTGAAEVIVKVTFFILRFLPLGVMCLIAKTTAQGKGRLSITG